MFALFHLGPKLKCCTRTLAPSANCCNGLVLSWCLFCDDWWASTHCLSSGRMIQPEIFKFSIHLRQWNTCLAWCSSFLFVRQQVQWCNLLSTGNLVPREPKLASVIGSFEKSRVQEIGREIIELLFTWYWFLWSVHPSCQNWSINLPGQQTLGSEGKHHRQWLLWNLQGVHWTWVDHQPKLFLPTSCNALSVNMCLPQTLPLPPGT